MKIFRVHENIPWDNFPRDVVVLIILITLDYIFLSPRIIISDIAIITCLFSNFTLTFQFVSTFILMLWMLVNSIIDIIILLFIKSCQAVWILFRPFSSRPAAVSSYFSRRFWFVFPFLRSTRFLLCRVNALSRDR